MEINKILMEYDSMFGKSSLEEIEKFLTDSLDAAYEEADHYSAITLLNELMGFCRDTSQNEKGEKYCKEVVSLMLSIGLGDTVEFATTLLNVANAYRAFGLFEESEDLYKRVENIYREKLPAGEFNYASLYNNWSLLRQETEDFEGAREKLEKALFIVDSFPGAIMEQATTRTNLAVTMLRLNMYDAAIKHLKKSLEIYEADGGRDFHYSGALSAMGDALYFKQDYLRAMDYYLRAMQEIEKHVGKTEAYERVSKNYDRARHMLDAEKNEQINNEQQAMKAFADTSIDIKDNPYIYKNNMERCRAFYEKYGKSMIKECFGEYEIRIAVGVVGEGSDCFGYDDKISMDHDYGVGFCMWLADEDYESIGEELAKRYDELVSLHQSEYLVDYLPEGMTAGNADKETISNNEATAKININKNLQIKSNLNNRRGVFTIKEFYGNILGAKVVNNIDWNTVYSDKTFNLPENDWLDLCDETLAVATNGQVFRDDSGVFSAVREGLLSYYPDKIWYLKLAENIHTFSQNGQYNYARMMGRGDYVTANICKTQAIKSAMSLTYLLNRKYAPYYKWMWRGLDKLYAPGELKALLEEITLKPVQAKAWDNEGYNPYYLNNEDEVVCLLEKVAAMLLGEFTKQGILEGDDTFLDSYVAVLKRKAELKMDREKLIEEIVLHEWHQFDKVKNEGGRADCQDDWNTFSIMRKSQYNAWTDELLESYLADLIEAEEKGWNLIMEKYARMMESTTPARYKELEKDLPVRSPERIAIQEEIIKIQVEWMEEFADEYPKMAGNARSIHTKEDNPFNTSYETYLRGELGTYSERTLLLYGRFVVSLKKEDENLAYNIMNNTAKLYGYSSVEDAESRL